MKLYKYLFIALVASLASCTDDAVDALTGVYQAPTDLTVTSAQNVSVEKVTKTKRIFTVDLYTQGGDVITMKLVGDNYFVHSAAYTPAEESAAKKGNYIIGENGSSYKGANGNTQAVVKGTMQFSQDGSNYAVSGNLWLADGNVMRLKGNVTLEYEADPVAIPLTKCLSYANNTASGNQSISLVLATDDVEAVPNAWGGIDYAGEGNYLAVDFYSTDGSLALGTYGPADANNLEPMTYGKGWDPGDLWGIGIMFENWATCWWTIEGGVSTAKHIEAGNIVVATKGNKYVITYDYEGLFFEFEGTIDQLNAAGGDSYDTQLTSCLSASDNNANGTKSITLNLATAGVTATPNAWGGVDITGEGNYLAVDLYSDDGKLHAGTYKAADANAMTAFTYGKGWDPGDLWGIGMVFENWGTCWWTVDPAGNTASHIEDGDIIVEYSDGIFTISYAHGDISIQYKGEIPGIEGVGATDTPAIEYVVLTTCLSASNNVPNGTKSVSLQLATDGVTSTFDPATWQTTYSGDGYYLAIDLYSEDGSIAAGTYEAADSNAMAPFTFGKGWDPGDLWGIGMVFENWGTCWWTVDNSNTSAVHIEEGTVTVNVDGDTYIITIESPVANAQFVGELKL